MKKLLLAIVVLMVLLSGCDTGPSQEDFDGLSARLSVYEKFSEDLAEELIPRVFGLETTVETLDATTIEIYQRVESNGFEIDDLEFELEKLGFRVDWNTEYVNHFPDVTNDLAERLVLLEIGGSGVTDEVGFDVYCDDELMNAGAIEHKFATIHGGFFNAVFSIKNGGLVNEPCSTYFIVPHRQPSGYVNRYAGIGELVNNARGYYLLGKSEWRRMADSRWGLRIEFSNFNIETGELIGGGGAIYAGKRSPSWTARAGDWIHVYAEMP